MKQRSFEFNGIRKEYLNVLSRRKTYWAPVKRNFIYIPGRPGALVSDTVTDVRVEEVHVEISTESEQELRNAAEDLSAWLITEEPGKLIFDDEPDRMYYAVVEGGFDPDEIVSKGYGTITFIYPNSYKYGIEEKEVTFESSASFDVEGTVETEPVIEVTLKADTEYVAVSNGEQLNMIGFPAKQDQTPVEPLTQIFRTSGETLTGWTDAAEPSLEGYPLTGTLKTDGNKFYSDDYGTNANEWHGPAKKTSLPEAVQDFQFSVGLHAIANALGQAGGVEVSMLDASSRIVCKIAMTKHFPGINTFYGRVRAGTKDVGHDVIPEEWAKYGNIECIFKVIRRGNHWTAQIHAINYGWSYINHTWTDTENIANAPVTQVQVRLYQRTEMPVIDQMVNDIVVERLNDLSENQIPIIGKSGDIVTFDHINNIIRRNGEDITKRKAFIGQYFSLKSGLNSIAVEPASAVESVKVRYQPKWR